MGLSRWTHCYGNIVRQMSPSLAARESHVAETNFAARKQKMFLPEVKPCLLPGHKCCFRNICSPV